ncbi:MAG: Na/Pi cotransporter family protein [Flavobacteriales bacterium]|jgi:phosphate:Na+ symporter|nr:Na/Pi cotransporter family protein [Flavobacteriales bacterium]MBK6549954.1 Na/Pi cotransporter family protein [Flavobacteriales bacterium]MBK6881879.1 Na/Pi cotransporter family protein [Flavobacteriales bacterium]MBK7102465.1 Na/Pi cotransporter family protein [Flavobacteriales bacterium]MBK7113205.1 Na/Pi cotransporter family protein [Flavobacteriales bacterium]
MRFGFLEFLTLAGSLGLFIYGMKLMSEGLQKVAGGRMRSVLKAMTANRFMGMFTGFVSTTVIQSSSAATVMVVSFVNAGLLQVRQAIPVIMGANIGTTVKILLFSWAVFVDFSITKLAIPIIGLAFPLLFLRTAKTKALSEFLIGAALLFLGLEFMKQALPRPSAQALEFLRDLSGMGYGSVLLFVGIGMVLTMLIQSSSASIALTLVLCENGTIGYEMAAALVLGENIGTTITANLAALVGNAWAKRTARAHFVFNVIGVVWALFLFHPYLRGLDQLVSEVFHSSPFTDPAAVKWALTFLHISFNTITTLLLIGFIPFIERIVTWMVPTKTDDDEVYRLDYLDSDIPLTPEVSLMEARKEISRFGRITNDMLGMVRELLTVKDNKQREHLMAQLAKYEQITDRLEIEVGKYLTKTSTEVRSEEASSRIQGLLAITGDLERVGDIFFQMSKSIERKVYDRLWFSPEQRQQLMEMMDLLERAFTVMRRNMEVDQDQVALDEAVEAEQRINQKRDLLRRTHLKSMESGDYNVKSGLIYNDLFSSCEKVGDHLINVSEALAGEV